MSDDTALRFIESAIEDVRTWIQALDTKTAILFAALFLPLAIAGEVVDGIHGSFKGGIVDGLFTGRGTWTALTLLFWTLSAYLATTGLNPAFNPAKAISATGLGRPLYFAAARYKTGLLERLFLRCPGPACSVDVVIGELPQSEARLLELLVAEHLKLSSILAAKIVAFRWSLWLSCCALVSGVIAALFAR